MDCSDIWSKQYFYDAVHDVHVWVLAEYFYDFYSGLVNLDSGERFTIKEQGVRAVCADEIADVLIPADLPFDSHFSTDGGVVQVLLAWSSALFASRLGGTGAAGSPKG